MQIELSRAEVRLEKSKSGGAKMTAWTWKTLSPPLFIINLISNKRAPFFCQYPEWCVLKLDKNAILNSPTIAIKSKEDRVEL